MIPLIQRAAQVLRDPAGAIDEGSARFAEEVPRLLALIVLGAAVFGGVAGAARGGVQIPFAAIKMPALLLIPMLLVLPALRGLWGLCDVDVSYRRLVLAGLVGGARAALLMAAAGPVLWLVLGVLPYHAAILAFAAVFGVCGLPGIAVVVRAALHSGRGRWMALAGSLALLGLSTMQTGWMLRPFLVRPQSEQVVFLRPLEDDIFTALGLTSWSSLGVYRDDAVRR
jgi:hypothetical protein